jgi:hypothetical protein
MKKQMLRFAPWVMLMVVGTIATSRTANTAEPPQPHEGSRLRVAYDALREARAELERSRTDFCGHKRAALDDTQRAMNQIKFAMDCRPR